MDTNNHEAFYSSEKVAVKRHDDTNTSNQVKKPAALALTVASTQHTFIRPGYESNSNFYYTYENSGPFIVHVVCSGNDESSSSNHMRALRIAQIIYNT